MQAKDGSNWTKIAHSLTKLEPEELKSKLSLKYLPEQHTPFYRQVLDIWYQFYAIEPIDNDIIEENLWNNKFILIDNKPAGASYKRWKEHGIIKIKHILNEERHFLTEEQMNDKYRFRIASMSYNSIKNAIPKMEEHNA